MENYSVGNGNAGNVGAGAVGAGQAAGAAAGNTLPSLYAMKCPKCGGIDFDAIGVKGGVGKAVATQLIFGAVGNLVASSNAAKNVETTPIVYRCRSCKEKWETYPLNAAPEEILPAPCTVDFTRVSSFVGAAVLQFVYLNGIKMGPVKNGKTLSFPTYLRYNTIFVTDHSGAAFKGLYRFEAQPGGTVQVRFNRKFL
ncbi:MAG: hypothetical protein LBR77_02345 [Lachnospiraceae bacterium]|nr:hypothetical protein [Lachnospiraceae bacterium]